MNNTLFDIRRTRNHQALTIRGSVFCLLFAFIAINSIAVLFAEATVTQAPLPFAIGGGLLLWSTLVLELFRRWLVRQPTVASDNAAASLSYHIVLHWQPRYELSPHAMLEAAMRSDRGLFVLHSIGIGRNDIRKALAASPLRETFNTCLEWCMKSMGELGATTLDSTVTIYAFLSHVPALKTLTDSADLSADDLKKVLTAESFHDAYQHRKHRFFSPTMLVHTLGSIGRSWVIGYNTDLERLTTNLSSMILHQPRSVVAHAATVLNAVRMLESNLQSNILLLGRSGTGRKTMIRNIAYELRKHELLHSKAFSDVLLLKSATLLSGSTRSDQALLQALNDANEGGQFILVIEDVTELLKAANPILREILLKVLTANNIRTICIAEPTSYHQTIAADPSLSHLFQVLQLDSTADEETMSILLETYFSHQKKTSVRVTYKALKTIIELSKRFGGNKGMPGTAVDVLLETMEHVRIGRNKVVMEEDIRADISRRAHVDIQTTSERGKNALLHLKERLEASIVGQAQAIDALVAALKRGKLHVGSDKRPVGTFLFLGTTGLGKTETAKALAREYFGSSETMIRIDLNEYSSEASIPLLIGGQSEGKFTEGLLTTRIQDHPASLVLLDEIEKAHPKVLNLFLQILDEGFLTTGNGERSDFRNAIIIATSNAGSRWIHQQTGIQAELTQEDFRKALLETVIGERTFSPEFINRFDEVIVFTQPTPEEVKTLASRMLEDVIKRFADEKGITVTVEPAVIDLLAERGFSREFGAREMRRTITKTVENYLAEYLLSHSVTRGDEIKIRVEDWKK